MRFHCDGREYFGYEGEPIIAALRANGIVKLRESSKSRLPWGPFCMQGRCCSCAMTVNGEPNVLTCVTPLKEGDRIETQKGVVDPSYYRRMPSRKPDYFELKTESDHEHLDVAVVGAGPAGLEAAVMAAEAGVRRVVVFDDKEYMGGQLALQTHDFFGTEELGASKRGFVIAEELRRRVETLGVEVRLNSTVVGLYPENVFAFKDGDRLNFASARKLILATGASEKMLPFPGNYLPGVMGAGGAQTFMNIYGVRPADRALIVGGGNIGVILAYQLLQAGVEVAAVVEAAPRMGAYGVHVEKSRALGVPVLTSHTIREAVGRDQVEAVCVHALDERWRPVPGSERWFEADAVCIAVGLNPLNELLWQAGCDFTFIPGLGEVPRFNKFRRTSLPDVFVAGDCAVIGEASIARLEGRIAGLVAARDLGCSHRLFHEELARSFELLDSIQRGTFGERLGRGKAMVCGVDFDGSDAAAERPYRQGLTLEDLSDGKGKVLIECPQDIPCNPCEVSCRFGAITIGDSITARPDFDPSRCVGCGVCVARCPGRAIRMYRRVSDECVHVTFPYEFVPLPAEGDDIVMLDGEGREVCSARVVRVSHGEDRIRCTIVTVACPADVALKVRSAAPPVSAGPRGGASGEDEAGRERCSCAASDERSEAGPCLVCRCEEVESWKVEEALDKGYRSFNELKRLLRVGMGPCRGLSCRNIIEDYLKRKGGLDAPQVLDEKLKRREIYRPPIKRITLGEAARLRFTDDEIRRFVEIERKRTIPQELLDSFIWDEIPVKRSLRRKVVIVGGGISGVMTAWWLAREGWDGICVVEREFLCAGATGACLGGIRTGFGIPNKVARARKGLEIYRDAERLIGASVGWHQGGYVYLAFDDAQKRAFEESARVWDENGVPYEFVSGSRLEELVPGVASEDVVSAVYFPEAGGANPFLAVFRFAEHAASMGVEFLVRREVRDIVVTDNKVRGVTLDDGTHIECEHVVNAAGSFAVRVSRMVGIDLSPDFWVERHGAFITEKMPLWLEPLVVSYHPRLSGYWQQKRMEPGVEEGEIVACYSPEKPIHGYNTHSYVYFLARMAQSILTVQPGLEDVGIVRNSAHHYVGRASGVPLIGPSEVEGFWHNIAKKGHGFMCAPGDAWALVQSMRHGERHEWISECVRRDVGAA